MRSTPPPPPRALVVFLENGGHISGVNLPRWVSALVDFAAEEYAKLALRLHGAYRAYDRVFVLEDDRATGPDLSAALIAASRTHRVDLLILAHGAPGRIIGHKGKQIGHETWQPLLDSYSRDRHLLRLRAVWQMNCYGLSLTQLWRDLGAISVNGSVGVNWLPEPSLSLFLRAWLRGDSFGGAVVRSSSTAERWWRTVYRSGVESTPHPRIDSSRQVVVGDDCTWYD